MFILNEVGYSVPIQETLEQRQLPFVVEFRELDHPHGEPPPLFVVLRLPHGPIEGVEERPDIPRVLSEIAPADPRS